MLIITWSRAAVAGISNPAGNGTGNTITETLIDTTTEPVVVNYVITPSVNGCQGIIDTVKVTVNPSPSPSLSGPPAACLNSAGNIYSTDPGMTAYAWNVSAGGTITAGGTTTDNNITVPWNTAGPQTVSVNYTDANGCTAAIPNSLPVMVVDQPSWITYSAPAGNICAGTGVSFSVAVIGGLGGTINWVRALTPGGAGITVTSPDFPPAVGTYYYRPQYSATGSGCSLADGTETQVNVVDQPSWITYSAPAGNICAGTSVSFSVAVIGGLGGTINWVRALTPGGAGITVTSPDFPPAVGTYYYRPQYSATGSGCSLADGTETQVNVVDQPSWNSYSAPAGNICAGTSVSFSVAVIGGLGGTINWVRALTPGGAGITVTSPDFPPAVGTYYYRPQYSATGSGCSLADGTETQVNVVDQPSWITYSAPAGNICAGTGVSFSVAVIGGLGGTINWVRALTPGGAGITVTSPDFPPAVGTYYYRPQYSATGSGCSLSDGTEYTVVDNPVPFVSNSQLIDTICNGSLTNISLQSNVPGTSFSWSIIQGAAFGASGGIGNPISQILTLPLGTLHYDSVIYSITPTGPLPTFCLGNATNFKMFIEPTVTISAPNDTICNGTPTNIVVSSSNVTTNGIKYTWTVIAPGSVSGASANSSGQAVGTSYYSNAYQFFCQQARGHIPHNTLYS